MGRLMEWCGAAAIGLCASACVAGPTISIEVDATDVARRLVSSRMSIAGIESGALDLWFPKYVPGNHAASGPVQNVGNLRITDCNGAVIPWDRSPRDQHRISLVTPEGCTSITIEQTYIMNQPSVLSRSSDCYGFRDFAGLNWNCLLWYPGGYSQQEIEVSATVRTHPEWSVATSLDRAESCVFMAGYHCFAPAPLGEVIDSPMIMGRVGSPDADDSHLRSYVLDVQETVPHLVHTVSSRSDAARVPAWLLGDLEEMVRQGLAVFGDFPREDYHMLIVLDDEARFGLEHGRSTYIGMRRDTMRDAVSFDDEGGGSRMTVIPHEYVHVWVGKLAAPAGLVREAPHLPIDSDMLWVYEGLTTYYTDILAVRSGLLTRDGFEHRLAGRMATAERRAGRLWRSVEDTARAVEHVRTPSRSWTDLRRTAEYYSEAAMFWMEADAIIRSATDNAKSLDDVCRDLFDVDVRPVGDQATFTRADVIRALRAQHDGVDWDALIERRIELPVRELSMARLARGLGYELAYDNDPTEIQADALDGSSSADLRSSIGLSINSDGEVTAIVPGSAADLAGIGFDDVIVGVGEYVFDAGRARDAVRDSTVTGEVDLLIAQGDRLRRVVLDYGGGMRWPRLVRDVAAGADVMSWITGAR